MPNRNQLCTLVFQVSKELRFVFLSLFGKLGDMDS